MLLGEFDISTRTLHLVKLFRGRMQNYVTLCDKIIQHYATLDNPRRYIAAHSRPYRRQRPFCGDNYT